MSDNETLTEDMILQAWESITTPLMRDALRIQTVKMNPRDVAKMERITSMPPLLGWKVEIHEWMPPGFVAALDKGRKLVAVFKLNAE